MELALYGEHGFYMRPTAGRPGGGATSSRRRRSDRCSAPSSPGTSTPSGSGSAARPFTVVDAGAGPGTLARSVLAAGPSRALDATAATSPSRSPTAAARPRHPDGHRVAAPSCRPADRRGGHRQRAARQPAVPAGGVRRRVARGVVDLDRSGRFVEVLSAPFDPVPRVLPPHPTLGPARRCTIAAAGGSTTQARSCRRGRWWRSTTACPAPASWRCGRGASGCARTVGTSAAATTSRDPGSQDITIDVAVRPAARAGRGPLPVAVPAALGDRRAGRRGRAGLDRAAARPGPRGDADAQPGQRSRSAARPAGLGAFLVAEWRSVRRTEPAAISVGSDADSPD